MISWVVAPILRGAFAKLSAGDPSAVLGSFSPGARFCFPGTSSFAIDTTDRALIEAWFERFAALRLNFEVTDVVAQGPPWAMKVRARGADTTRLPDGRPYRNEWAQAVTMRWGKIVEDIIYVDTELVHQLDAAVAG